MGVKAVGPGIKKTTDREPGQIAKGPTNSSLAGGRAKGASINRSNTESGMSGNLGKVKAGSAAPKMR